MYLSTKEMQRRYGVARETLRRWERNGRIPKRKNPSGLPKGRRYWLKSEVEDNDRRF
jgi:DNA-binding transcriptional MerR regulator